MIEHIDFEVSYRVLQILEEEPSITQRDLARRLGVSLGKANYCLQALIGEGFVKVRNFKNNQRKAQYVYVWHRAVPRSGCVSRSSSSGARRKSSTTSAMRSSG